MKKRIVSLVLLTAMAMPMIQPITTEYSSVAFAEEATPEEYTSELNPIKPSEAPDDYVIKFKNDESKKFIMDSLELNKSLEDDITFKEIKSKIDFDGNFEKINQDIISLEGIQYCVDMESFKLSNGKYDETKMTDFLEPIRDLKKIGGAIYLTNFGLTEIPKIERFKNAVAINLINNKIKNLDGLEYYKNLVKIDMSSNEINDISGLIPYRNQLTSLYFSNNKINSETFRKAFAEKYTKFTIYSPAVFSYNQITDTSFVTNIEKINFTKTYFGKQNVVKVIEKEEFDFPISTHYARLYKEDGSFDKFLRGSADEPLTVSLDNSDDLEKIDNEKYKIKDSEKLLITAYWNKNEYDDEYNPEKGQVNASIWSSGIVNIVNLIPLNKAIEKARVEPNEQNIMLANEEYNRVKLLKQEYNLDSEELDNKIEELEKYIDAFSTIDEEHRTIYNPIAPSVAVDSDIVTFPDEDFRRVIENLLNIGENQPITVGDMRKLTNTFHTSQITNAHGNLVTRQVENIEGLQYAENLNSFSIFFSSSYNYEKNREDYFKGNEISEISNYTGSLSPIKNLQNIKSIIIHKTNITSADLKDLNKHDLETLSIYGSKITELSPISHMKNLKKLALANSFITNADLISEFTKLENLHLDRNMISNFDFLTNLPKLKILWIDRNIPDIRKFENGIDISPVANLKELEEFSSKLNGISDISSISELKNLVSLNLDSNLITDISELPSVSHYSTLDMQAKIVIIENENYKFDMKLLDSNGKSINILRKTDMEIKELQSSSYELIDRKAIVVYREWDTFDSIKKVKHKGVLAIYNKMRVNELINIAKNNPSESNIKDAERALSQLYELPTLRAYVEQSRKDISNLIGVSSIQLDISKLDLEVGKKEKLTATVAPENATNKDVEWSSSDDKIAKVDASGNVTAVAEGKATITAKVKGTNITDKAEVTVTKEVVEKPNTDVKPTSVRLNSTSAELKKDDTYQLRATVNPTNSTQKDIEWTSTNNSVATVDGNGLVKAVGEGTATIRARVKGTEVSTTAAITVKADEKPVKAESIELDASKVDMQEGQTDKLVATVKPEKATNKEVEWSSSDENVVKVDANGNIEAIGAGTAKVTAKVKGTDITAETEIVVTEKAKPVDTTTKFTDINGHWAKAFIEHAFTRGLFKGTTETLFSPDSNMTRGMFVTVLGRLAGETAEPNDKFSDVNSEVYYAKYIAWAEENGIVEGYGNGEFGPDNNVTREEMAAIIERYMEYKKINLEDNNTAEFADNDKVSEWAKESVAKIQKAGIIEGKGNGIFDPQANSTRAEVATLLIRMIEKYID